MLRWKEIHYPLYKKGHLLVPGGISSQPARWLEAMRYLEQLEAQQEAKHMELNKPPEPVA